MEVYIDDMLVKSQHAKDHITHLRQCFDTLNKYGMKLNPAKCTFAVKSGEFLGYLVTRRGIEANPKQIKAIIDLPLPKNAREVQRLTGRIAALNRFISRSTDKCLPFYQLLKTKGKFEWAEACHSAFNELKSYLSTPPILAKPELGEILFLYIAVSESAVSGVLVKDDRGEQRPVFYISKSLDDAETRHPTVEKVALAVVTSARKLRPYFQSHIDAVLSNHPLRSILHSPNQSGRLTKWAIELSEYDIEYRTRLAAKSQVLADFLIELPFGEAEPTLIDPSDDRWTLHVDGASSHLGSGVGIRLTSPTGEILEQSFRLRFQATNNVAEYEALIAGLKLANRMQIKRIRAFCDSQLVANQFSGEYDTKSEPMAAYLDVVRILSKRFDEFELIKIPRGDNAPADTLAALASTSDPDLRRIIPVESIDTPSISETYPETCLASDSDVTDWRVEIRAYLADGDVPADKWAKRRLKAKAAHYTLMKDHLLRWTASGALLLCIHGDDTERVMMEMHEGAGGNHSGGRALALRIRKHGHYWPTMISDCEKLDELEEERDKALLRIQNYQLAAVKYYNKKVHNRHFDEGDLVLRKVFENTAEPDAGKMGANWEGPYLVSKVVHPGVYELLTMGGEPVPRSWNSMHLKRYYY
ncbi:PREDICTED: uncharacterized protein LOC104772525 [Camelina sativa]|uniref:Uncharacterized protein LOC104772525 n=1 Tax=Camelina sativa TaxID=90675 RepID=A0ABM0Y4N6_CAMSA|nr:PREDICTED: uncharacterized protein LOC104772525 [Camelina sativa]